MTQTKADDMNVDDVVEEGGKTNGSELPRRAVLAVGAAGLAGVALAACSSGSTSSPSSSAAAPTEAKSGSASPSTSGAVLTTTAAGPVGGAKLAKADGTTWLVAQPSAGQFVCHSGICTHEGCPLTEVSGDEGICQCHGSKFNANTGAVIQGPATKPLAKQSVSVSGGNVVLG